MEDTELKAIVNAEIRSAMGYMGGDLSNQRAQAMDYYLGEPFGNEMEGRSSVVSREVAETIEWIMPSLMRIFSSGDKAVEFDPVGVEDEPQAEQETDYCNYIFYKKNEGFLILYTWFKDALLQKNGIIKPYCEKKEESSREEYQGLTDGEWTILLSDPELEATAHSERMITVEVMGQQLPVKVHDAVFRRNRVSHDIVIDNVPPEEFLITSKAKSPDPKKAFFTAHRSKKTISDLLEMGYDEATVKSLPSDDHINTEAEYIARRNITDELSNNVSSTQDKSMREVWVYECYIKVDYDGDGKAELRKVTMAGNEILDNEETDRIPFCSLTPIILTHKFFGLSIADLVRDLQLIKSTIWRQILDNLYLNNNSMIGAQDGRVNLDDLLTRRPGGVVRTMDSPGQNLMPIVPPPLPTEAFNMISYLDEVKETRTGVGKQFQGLNADILKEANIPAVQGLLSAAQQRVEMIARIFAETGVKQLFMDIHELASKYQNIPEVVKLKNNWVEVDPREWRQRTNMTVSVGLGSASKDQQLIAINSIITDQTNLAQNGGLGVLVKPENIYNALKKKAHINGFKNADEFFSDPSRAPPAPPQGPSPEEMALQAQMQIEQGKRQSEKYKTDMANQAKAMELQFKQQDSIRQAQIEQIGQEIEVLKIKLASDSENKDRMVEIVTSQIQGQLQKLDSLLKNEISVRDAVLEKYKADLDSNTVQMINHTNNVYDSLKTSIIHHHEHQMKTRDHMMRKVELDHPSNKPMMPAQ